MFTSNLLILKIVTIVLHSKTSTVNYICFDNTRLKSVQYGLNFYTCVMWCQFHTYHMDENGLIFRCLSIRKYDSFAVTKRHEEYSMEESTSSMAKNLHNSRKNRDSSTLSHNDIRSKQRKGLLFSAGHFAISKSI